MNYQDILEDTLWAVRLMNNKVIRVKGKEVENYYDDDSVKLIIPELIENQSEHLKEFYRDYKENLNKPWDTRIDNLEEFYNVWRQ